MRSPKRTPLRGSSGYAMVFFAIWWAWMNFTWFASAYDCDDVPYRLAVFVQIAGALILAAGVPAMFETPRQTSRSSAATSSCGWRWSAQWLRAAASDPERRTTADATPSASRLLQVAWVGMLAFPHLWVRAFVTFVVAELLVPVWAERAGPTTWHPHHIAERYGLLTLIVLGESILVGDASPSNRRSRPAKRSLRLTPLIVGGLLIVFSMWWMYFDRPVHDLLTDLPKSHRLGLRALSRVRVSRRRRCRPGRLGRLRDASRQDQRRRCWRRGRHPRRCFHLCLWFLHDRPDYRQTRGFGPVAAIAILLTPLSGNAVPLVGLILASVITIKLFMRRGA